MRTKLNIQDRPRVAAHGGVGHVDTSGLQRQKQRSALTSTLKNLSVNIKKKGFDDLVNVGGGLSADTNSPGMLPITPNVW